MRSHKQTLTHYVALYGTNGKSRRVAVSLPFVACIAEDKHYTATPAPPPAKKAPAMTDHVIRKALGKDPRRTRG